MTIVLGRIRCHEDILIPGSATSRGLNIKRVGGDTPSDHSMSYDEITGLVTIRMIARTGVPPVYVPRDNICFMEAMEAEPFVEVPVVAPVVVVPPAPAPAAPAPKAAVGPKGKITVGDPDDL